MCGQLNRSRLNKYGLVYRCNVNFRTQDGDLIKTVPVYSTMDVKQDDIPVGTLVTVSFDKDAFADSGLTFDHWDIKGLKDPTAYNKMEKFTFEMPKSTVTLEGMSRDSSIDDGPDLLGTAAIIGTAVVGTAILAYQGHQLGTELYLTYLLPSGAVIPQNRIQLAMLLWQDAGDPAPPSPPWMSSMRGRRHRA